MAVPSEPGAQRTSDNDMPAHERGYGAFLRMFKWGAVAATLVTAFVIYVLVA